MHSSLRAQEILAIYIQSLAPTYKLLDFYINQTRLISGMESQKITNNALLWRNLVIPYRGEYGNSAF